MENESDGTRLAELATAYPHPAAELPALQFSQVPVGRDSFIRWAAQPFCRSSRALHVLLAKVLLVYFQNSNTGMKTRVDLSRRAISPVTT